MFLYYGQNLTSKDFIPNSIQTDKSVYNISLHFLLYQMWCLCWDTRNVYNRKAELLVYLNVWTIVLAEYMRTCVCAYLNSKSYIERVRTKMNWKNTCYYMVSRLVPSTQTLFLDIKLHRLKNFVLLGFLWTLHFIVQGCSKSFYWE